MVGTIMAINERTEHKDILGRVISVGDVVAMASHNNLTIAIVDKLNPKMIKVKQVNSTWSQNKYPQDLIIIPGPEAMVYLLRNI